MTQTQKAALELQDGERARIAGELHFTTVSPLLKAGSDAIRSGRASVIDLGGVTESDSTALALLIEWLSVADQAQRKLRYENIPVQIQQLARLSDVDELLEAK